MNFRNNLLPAAAWAVVLAMTLASCGKGEDLDATTENYLLAYVPEDTPYLAGNLEPIPEDVIEATFRRAQPALDAAQAVLADTRISLSGSAAEENPGLAVMGAMLDELDGKLNRQGLESLGFTMKAHQAIHGLGVFPVFRLSLGSAQALRDTIGRIEASSGIVFPEQHHQSQAYWKVSAQAAGGPGEAPVGAYIAIIEEPGGAHLAIGLFPTSAEAELLPAFLGQLKPDSSNAALRLAEINRTYGYTPYGSGLVDIQRLFDQFADPASLLRQTIDGHGDDMDFHLDQACQAEVRALIARAPRMIAGATELTPSAMAAQYRLETAGDLAAELAALVSSVPPAPTESDRLLEFAFGIRVGAARDFLIRKATEYSQETFECEALKGINDQASKALVKLNYPLPPLVNNFQGLRASLSAMPEDERDLGGFLGTVALHVDKPEMFVGMAQMFLPQLAELQIIKGAPPVRLPDSLVPVPGIVAHAAMSDTALGIAVGEGEEARLLDYLQADTGNAGSFFSVNYDLQAYMDRIDALTEDLKRSGVPDDSIMDGEFEGASTDADRERGEELAEAVREAFGSMAGRSRLSLRFDEHGFAVDSRMVFKD